MKNKVLQSLEDEAFDILEQLEHILDHDPLIDEVGFIHPAQLLMLNEEADAVSLSPERQEVDVISSCEVSGADGVGGKNAFFWNRDHKLGISTTCLLPLYKAAKHRFMEAFVTYKMHIGFSMKHDNVPSSAFSEIEHAVMRHSKALLLLSSDFGTAWNARKLILSKRGECSISDELLVSALILSFAPKSENAWSYRRWVIKRIAGSHRCATVEELLEKESKLVEKMAEKSKMNYRAWNHRCWLISYMTSQQVRHELNATRNWASLHVADSSCFHYRRKLMLMMLGDSSDGEDVSACSSQLESLRLLWKDELEWNEVLIRRYIGREALWLHRRFLSVLWVKNLGAEQYCVSKNPDEKDSKNNHGYVFIDGELDLLQDCLSMSDNEFDDVQSQAIHSVTYILCLYRETFLLSNIELNQKFGDGDLMKLLNRLCPGKTKVWDSLLSNLSLQETANLC